MSAPIDAQRPKWVGTASSSGREAVAGGVRTALNVLRPKCVVQLPFEPVPVAGPNDCLMPGSVSTPACAHRPQPLHSCPPMFVGQLKTGSRTFEVGARAAATVVSGPWTGGKAKDSSAR